VKHDRAAFDNNDLFEAQSLIAKICTYPYHYHAFLISPWDIMKTIGEIVFYSTSVD
jgi:hypothetical protein